MEESAVLRVENLGVLFEDGNEVLKDLSFSVRKGDVLAVVGPNGAGKSVLIRALLNLVPHTGSIAWAPGLKVSYIPQKLAIDKDLPLSVEEFLNFKEAGRDKIITVLRAVGFTQDEHHIEHHILAQRLGWLSGGQLQRIFIAWSLLDRPDVLLYDEPTSGIDVGGEETIYNLLARLQKERAMTIILISHDLNIVYQHATNVLCVDKRMVCYGAPSIVLDPAALAKLYGGDTGFFQHQQQ